MGYKRIYFSKRPGITFGKAVKVRHGAVAERLRRIISQTTSHPPPGEMTFRFQECGFKSHQRHFLW